MTPTGSLKIGQSGQCGDALQLTRPPRSVHAHGTRQGDHGGPDSWSTLVLWCSDGAAETDQQRRPETERHTVMLHQWSLQLEVEHEFARRRAVMQHSFKEVERTASAIQNVVARQLKLEFDRSARTVHRLWSSNNLICAIKRAC